MQHYLWDLPSGEGIALVLCEGCPDNFSFTKWKAFCLAEFFIFFYHSTQLLTAVYLNNLYPAAEQWWENAANTAQLRQLSALCPSLPREHCSVPPPLQTPQQLPHEGPACCWNLHWHISHLQPAAWPMTVLLWRSWVRNKHWWATAWREEICSIKFGN